MELLDKHFWLGGGCVGVDCCGEAAAILGESPVCCKVKLVLFFFHFNFIWSFYSCTVTPKCHH